MKSVRHLLAGVALLLTASAVPVVAEVCPQLNFVEAAAEWGLDFSHRSGASPARHLPESMGSGVVWLDYDGDGWLDLYLVQSGEFPPRGSEAAGNRLYRSLAGRGFADVTAASGAGDRGYGQGAVAGDLDSDGDTDLVIANFGVDVLLINQGDGTFLRRELDGVAVWSSSAALADLDGDGDLDLYIAAYVDYDPDDVPSCRDRDGASNRYCDPSLFRGAADRLLMNDGTGVFTPAAELPAAGLVGRGLGVVMVDLDGDLAPEIYVANDLTPNALWANDGGGGLSDLTLASGAAVNREGRSEAGMGIAVADVDGDLDPDIAVTNFDVETNTLYENLGSLSFRDVSAASGFGPPSLNRLGFGLVALDLERDGDADFWVANGHIFERPNRDNTHYAQPGQLLLGQKGRFAEIACDGPWNEPSVARGAAVGDADNDGDLEVVVQQSDGPVRWFVDQGTDRGFVGLDLKTRGGGAAVGAVATLSTSAGPRRQWVTAGDSYQSASDSRRTFAVPTTESEVSLDVTWRSGRRLRLLGPPLGSYLRLTEPASRQQTSGSGAFGDRSQLGAVGPLRQALPQHAES